MENGHRSKMILLISTCTEKLHEYEFVKPIEEILNQEEKDYIIKHYSELNPEGGNDFDKIIICGTSLKDYRFLEKIETFRWLENFENPVLGICSGMQILSLVFGGELKKKKEIGYYKEKFKEDFLGIKKNSEVEVYHLHNNYPEIPKCFKEYTNSEIPQAIKHKTKEIYGVLFHPEIRNKDVITNFLELESESQ